MPQPSGAPFVLGVGTALLVILAWLVASFLQTTRTAQLHEAETRLQKTNTELTGATYQDTLADYTALVAVTKQSKTLRDQRFLFLPTWQAVKESVPADMQIKTVSMAEDRMFRLTGTVKSVASFAMFTEVLGSRQGITHVIPLTLEKSGDVHTFQISFQASVVTPKAEATP